MRSAILLTVVVVLLVVGTSYPVSASEKLLEKSAENIDRSCAGYQDFLSNIIRKFLENLRSHMSTGIPSLHVPPLDPLHVPDEHFRLKKIHEYDLRGTTSNSKMEGLHEFNVSSISTSFLHMQANVSLYIPYLFLTGDYTLKGKALGFIPIRGDGPYILKPSGVDASVYTHMSISHGHVQMTSMDFKLNVGGVYANFKGLFGGGIAGNLANSLMNRFGLSLFRKIEPKIHERVRVALLAEINELLKDIPLADLIGFIGQKNTYCASELNKRFA